MRERSGPGTPLRRRLAGAVLRVTGRLPPVREEALLTLVLAARSLAGGRPQRRPPAGSRRTPAARAARALRAGDHEGARRSIDAILAAYPDDVAALGVLRTLQAREGALSEAIATTHRLRSIADSPALALVERQMVGRLIESAPGWVPRIAGPSRALSPRSPEVILHLQKESVPYVDNGSTVRSRNTVQAQRAAGLEPVVVTSLGHPRCAGVDVVPARETIDGVVYHRLDLGAGYPCDAPADLALLDQARLTARIALEERPALIHANSGQRGFDAAIVGLALREHIGIPTIYEVRSFQEASWAIDPERAESAELYRRRLAAEIRAMQSVDAVVTIADTMRDEIVSRGIPAERVHVIPNAVDAAMFAPRPSNPELRQRYGLDDGRTVIGYVSTLDHPREGHEVLLEATARLLRAGRQVRCLIVGGGRRQGDLETLADRLGIRRHVSFSGAVPHDRIADMYALIDIFVVPRLDDMAARFVTPLKPFEAMAAGRPLVVADLPALAEIVAPESRGLTFRPGDPDALAATVGRLLDDPELRRTIGERGRDWVERERSWERNAARYVDLYARVVAASSAAAPVSAR